MTLSPQATATVAAPAHRPAPPQGEHLPMRFPDFPALKRYIAEDYRHLPHELVDLPPGFRPNAHWAWRCSPRFFRALSAIRDHAREGASLLDIGGYPGSFVRLARACYGDLIQLHACGMPVRPDFLDAIAAEGIDFRAANLDPDVLAPPGMPIGLPYESGSIDIITCMEVVEHLYSLRTFFTECARVLSPGGILYVTTNNVLDRAGLLRALTREETNLDPDIDQTSIWSDHHDQWRGHVRFYSNALLGRTAARAGLSTVSAGYFENHEDPDVFRWDDRGPVGAVRARLRGHGERPPIHLKQALQTLLHMGPRGLAAKHHSHLEIVFQK